MKKIIRLTESDLKRIVKRVINEGVFRKFFTANLFPKSAPKFVYKFGDDAAKLVDEIIEIGLKRNKVFHNGQECILSASGKKVPLNNIDEGLEYLSLGKSMQDKVTVKVEGKPVTIEVQQLFPKQLADGTEFRSVIERAQTFKPKPVGLKTMQYGSKGKSFIDLARNSDGFIQMRNPAGNMSGWKFHIFNSTLDEAAFLYEKLDPVMVKWNAAYKLASEKTLNRLAKNPLQNGKGCTIYIPPYVIERNLQREFLSDIENAIRGYTGRGSIQGDKMINNTIGYRYELSKPISAGKGVDDATYRQLYKSNDGGPYNVPNNNDIF